MRQLVKHRLVRHLAATSAVAALLFSGASSAAAATQAAPSLPGATNTGVPADTVLRPSGNVWIRVDGTVVQNLDINGCVVVEAKNVTIKNSRIRCAKPLSGGVALAVVGRAEGVVVEDTEIDGMGRSVVGVGWSGYTLRRVNIHNSADGARFGHGVVIEDSWIHDLARVGDYHSDAVQTTSASNTIIRRNVLDAGTDHGNAAVMLGSETGTRKVRNVTIEQNVLSGGNFTVNVRGDITAEGISIQNNLFVPNSRYGQVQTPTSVPIGDGNSRSDQAPLTVKRAR